MAHSETHLLPAPNPEHRRAAAGQFERANQVIATGNYDYGIRLLLSCCKLDPGNLIYRQALRRTEKAKYRDNMRGAWWAWLLNFPNKARLRSALRGEEYARVLEVGEDILVRNPWDVPTQLAMAEAADALGLLDMAIWTLEQARQKNHRDIPVNRRLAQLYERRGNLSQAMALWGVIQKVDPDDIEAKQKEKDLAAKEAIERGGYRASRVIPPPESDADIRLENGAAEDKEEAPASEDRLTREVDLIRKRLERKPTSAELYLELAEVYSRAGELDAARAALQEGLGATGQAFELAERLAELDIEPFRKNLSLAEDKLKSDPENQELLRLRVRLRKEINARELELMRKRADRSPTELRWHYEVGLRLLRSGQIDEAIKELQLSREDVRYRWQSLLYLGHCFKGRNNWRLAQRNYEEALQALPASEPAARKELLYALAVGHAEAGALPRAIDAGHELANLDFGYREINRLIDEWQTKVESKPDE
jgi:tetratricopeptide (TPR) repeat protein